MYEWIFPNNPLKAVVIHIAGTSFSAAVFRSSQLSILCLVTLLCEQPASLAIIFCGLHFLWS